MADRLRLRFVLECEHRRGEFRNHRDLARAVALRAAGCGCRPVPQREVRVGGRWLPDGVGQVRWLAVALEGHAMTCVDCDPLAGTVCQRAADLARALADASSAASALGGRA